MAQRDAFPISYYDENDIWPLLRPSIEERLPLEPLLLRGVYGGGSAAAAAAACSSSAVNLSFVAQSAFVSGAPPPPAQGPPAAFSVAQKAAAGALASLGVSVAAASLAAAAAAPVTPAAAAAAAESPSLVWTAAERPFVHLLLLQYDSIEVYRQQQRRLLRIWSERLLEQHEEWLVVAAAACSSNEAVVKQQKKFIEKIRADLGSKDRVLRLPLGSIDPSNSALAEQLWAAFFQRLREALTNAVEYRIMLAEDAVQRMQQQFQQQQQQQQQVLSASVLAARDTLACLLGKCGRYSDALRVLDAWEGPSLQSLPRHPAGAAAAGAAAAAVGDASFAVGGTDGLPLLACEWRAAALSV
ncbi:hypothetical protein, conserved, partial [Eimeria tenella]